RPRRLQARQSQQAPRRQEKEGQGPDPERQGKQGAGSRNESEHHDRQALEPPKPAASAKGRPASATPATHANPTEPLNGMNRAGGRQFRQLAIDLEQVGRDQTFVGDLALRREILPAGYRTTADIRSTKTPLRKMLDRIVAHRVVEGDLFTIGNWPSSNEVTGTRSVELNTTVRVARMVDLGTKTAVSGP